MDWHHTILERLKAARNTGGGWGYRSPSTPAAEPTALACLALASNGAVGTGCESGLAWLAELQNADGGVPITVGMSAPCWPTALAVLAWMTASAKGTFGSDVANRYRAIAQRGANWLLAACGKVFTSDPIVYGHDTRLAGWSWVDGTHSWVEPTAYAILALRAAGPSDHPRVREGVTLLLDRALPDGGWNYGGKRVYMNTLRPFPGTSGIALAALAGEPPLHGAPVDARIEAGITYLLNELPRVRSPMSLAWGLIGLGAWNRRPAEAARWLAETAAQTLRAPANNVHDALLLLAGRERCPFITSVTPSYGSSVSAIHG